MPSSAPRPFWTFLGKLFRGAVGVLAVGYLVSTVAIALVILFVGEQWWISGVAMFLPQFGWALPLPVIVVLILIARMRRLLWTQLVAAWVVLVPLMGFNIPWPHYVSSSLPKVRVLTFNVNSCYAGVDQVAREILSPAADIVLVQELFSRADELAAILRRTYPVVEVSGQFLIATRYRLLTTVTPPRVSVGETMRTARFVRYTLDTPLGDVTIYNMHPLSPRGALWMARKGGFRRQLLGGHIFDGEMERATQYHAAVRAEQVGAVAEMAMQDRGAVLIAGDTNLPSTSPVLRRTIGKYQDAFPRAGWGLGYTFPEILPWMRLDRILASESLKFVGCEVACRHVSDHYCVFADLQRRDP